MTCDMEFEIFFYLHEQQQQNLTHLFSSKKPIFFPEKTSYFEFQIKKHRPPVFVMDQKSKKQNKKEESLSTILPHYETKN
ncbi:hypothetical protein DERF_005572 [Dermatophagoides farinae]|uniref:Uncharacterized protein n=1 Tax=Dermatophagoides farinae TaxID=6954 RepID=A0A922L6Q7_DERFA|nr:hypothetical protein DERF_005572 [Dermatophagoides farinae]